jgi:preprotein translocase subunit SecD
MRRAALGVVGLAALVLTGLVGCGSVDDSSKPSTGTTKPQFTVIMTFAPEGEGSPKDLDRAVTIVKERLRKLGVRNTTVARYGGTINVVAPDDDNLDRVEHLITSRGQVLFRPVLAQVPAGAAGSQPPVTPPGKDRPGQPVTLTAADDTSVYQLGPAEGPGDMVSGARAVRDRNAMWSIRLTLRAGAAGIDTFNHLAAACYRTDRTCPTQRVAITVDSRVASAPMIQERSFRRDEIHISGSFTEQQAKDLAATLLTGELPVTLHKESTRRPSD